MTDEPKKSKFTSMLDAVTSAPGRVIDSLVNKGREGMEKQWEQERQQTGITREQQEQRRDNTARHQRIDPRVRP